MTHQLDTKKPVMYMSGGITSYLKAGYSHEWVQDKFARDIKRACNLYAPFIPLNPTTLPLGLEYSAYMDIAIAMLRSADFICMSEDWQTSKGACAEHAYALSIGMEIRYLESQKDKVTLSDVLHFSFD